MKKKGLLIGTFGATVLLAGGVFAAYSITDNAGKIGIRISPDTIDQEAVGEVVLAWGDKTQFTDLSGLTVGTPATKSVVVTADAKDDQEQQIAYTGSLEVELQDLSGKAANQKKLIDYLTVEVYTLQQDGETRNVLGKLGTYVPINETEKQTITTETYSVSADDEGERVYFEVALDLSATPYMPQIRTDQVRLTVDWNRNNADAESGVKHVYIPANGWSAMYVYSHDGHGTEVEGFPGTQLSIDPVTGLYAADLLNNMQYFIFSDGNGNQYPGSDSAGMTRDSMALDTAGNIYFDWAQHKFTSQQPEVTFDYYLVGEATDEWSMLAANGFVYDSVKSEYVATVTVEANKEYKIRSLDGNDWRGYSNIEEPGQEQSGQSRDLVSIGATPADNNFKFNAAGTYDIYVKTNEAKGVWIATHVAA